MPPASTPTTGRGLPSAIVCRPVHRSLATMIASTDFTAPVAGQRSLRVILRGVLRLLFRGLIRPPLPIAAQRVMLRLLTAITLTPRGVERTAGRLGGRPCEWHRPLASSGNVMLYLH